MLLDTSMHFKLKLESKAKFQHKLGTAIDSTTCGCFSTGTGAKNLSCLEIQFDFKCFSKSRASIQSMY